MAGEQGPFTSVALQLLRDLAATPVEPDDLIFEALLWRGFLPERRGATIVMPPETPARDLELLSNIVELRSGEAGATLVQVDPHRVLHAATAVIQLSGGAGFSSESAQRAGWQSYRRQVWGHKVPIWPEHGPALDIGVALLVKALPLIRCHCLFSCDGHGEQPASVSFRTPWDLEWARAVIRRIAVPTIRSRWVWEQPDCLKIHLTHQHGSDAPRGMFEDVQAVARSWLDADCIEAIGEARRTVLDSFTEEPSIDEFVRESARVLAAASFSR